MCTFIILGNRMKMFLVLGQFGKKNVLYVERSFGLNDLITIPIQNVSGCCGAFVV